MRAIKIATIVAVTSISAGAGFFIVTASADPFRQRLRDSYAAEPAAPPPDSPFSADHHARMARIINDLARRSEWRDRDTALALEIVRPWTDEPVPGADDPIGLEAFMEWDQTMAVVATRIGWGVPTDRAVVHQFDESLIAMLDHPQAHVRRTALSLAYSSGRLADVRPVAERLLHDPDAGVRDRAARKLAALDGQPVPVGDCSTCPKGEQP